MAIDVDIAGGRDALISAISVVSRSGHSDLGALCATRRGFSGSRAGLVQREFHFNRFFSSRDGADADEGGRLPYSRYMFVCLAWQE